MQVGWGLGWGCFYFSELQEGLAKQNEDSEVRWRQNCGQVFCFGGKNLRGGHSVLLSAS